MSPLDGPTGAAGAEPAQRRDLGTTLIAGAFAAAGAIGVLNILGDLLLGWWLPRWSWLTTPFYLAMAVLYPMEVARGREARGHDPVGLQVARIVVGVLGMVWVVWTAWQGLFSMRRTIGLLVIGAVVGGVVIYLWSRRRGSAPAVSADEPGRPSGLGW